MAEPHLFFGQAVHRTALAENDEQSCPEVYSLPGVSSLHSTPFPIKNLVSTKPNT